MTDLDLPARIVAPWNDATIDALNAYQRAGRMHPFTCRYDSHHILVATRDGWVCELDDYTQRWAHAFMINPAFGTPWTTGELAGGPPPEPPASVWWHTITPQNAATIVLPVAGIIGPLSEKGIPCPWPWEPQLLGGIPLGQYHCPYCGASVRAGERHPDYRNGIV